MHHYQEIDTVAELMRQALQDNLSRLLGKERIENESMLQRLNERQEVVTSYRRLLRAEKLGLLECEFTRPETRRIFQAYVQMNSFLRTGRRTNVTLRRLRGLLKRLYARGSGK